MTARLYPPLTMLRSELFGEGGALTSVHDAQDDTVAMDDAAMPAAAMPSWLAELVRLRGAARTAHAGAPLAVGQVRRLDRIPARNGAAAGRELGRSCAVLLGASIGGNLWSGWMVAQETDYATERDLVLQDSDGLFAPEAGMVQAWNPVELALYGDEPMLGALAPASLGAVMLLAEPQRRHEEFVAPRPGRLGAWDIAPQTTIVSGTPLGGEDDPRHPYRQLYRELAQELRAASVTAPVASTEPVTAPHVAPWRRFAEWLRIRQVRPALAYAALAIIVGQGIWMLQLQQRQDGAELVYRGSGALVHTDPCAVLIRIVFRPDTAYTELVDSLRAADARLVSGPSGKGEIWVLPPRERDPGELAAMLRQQHVVEQVDVIEPNQQRCAK